MLWINFVKLMVIYLKASFLPTLSAKTLLYLLGIFKSNVSLANSTGKHFPVFSTELRENIDENGQRFKNQPNFPSLVGSHRAKELRRSDQKKKKKTPAKQGQKVRGCHLYIVIFLIATLLSAFSQQHCL